MGKAMRRISRCLHPRSVAALGIAVLLLAGCAGQPSDAVTETTETATEQPPPPPEPLAQPEQLVTASPDRYSRVGELVPGFPIDLLPVPGDAVILVTSAYPLGDADIQEVSLNLRTSASATELITMYRAALTDAGFTELPSDSATSSLAVDVTFIRSGGDELVSIGILDVDEARTVTIGGRVRTDS